MNKTKLSLFLLVPVLSSGAIVGCNTRGGSSSDVISISIVSDNAEYTTMNTFIKKYKEIPGNENKKFKVVKMTNYNDYIFNSFLYDELTDIIQVYDYNAEYYTNADLDGAGTSLLQSVTPFMKKDGINESDFFDSIIEMTKCKTGSDEMYWVPRDYNKVVCAYNKKIFDIAGVDYPTDNWTWDDFAAAARKIHEVTGNPAVTTLEYNSLAFSTVTQWKEGYNFYAMDGTDFAFNGDTAPIAFIFDLLTTLQAEGAIADYGIQNEIGSNIEADWIAFGDSAMVMLSSNQFQALSNVAAENGITLALATIPRVYPDGQSGMVVRSSQQMSIYKGSEKKEMAANFINFFINSVEANKILNCERGVSINSDVLAALKADEEKTNEVTAKVYTIIDLIGSFADAANSSPAEPAANEEISDVLKKTYFQGLTEGKFDSAQAAADQFWAEAQEIWAKF